MFDAHGNERIDQWRQLRNNLEIDQEPFLTALNVWCRAPLVNSYLDPSRPQSWPDPWHLILDNRYDELALTLGIMYTLKLTQRFMAVEFEIHTSMLEKESFYLLAADHVCFDIGQRQIIAKSAIPIDSITLIYQTDQEK